MLPPPLRFVAKGLNLANTLVPPTPDTVNPEEERPKTIFKYFTKQEKRDEHQVATDTFFEEENIPLERVPIRNSGHCLIGLGVLAFVIQTQFTTNCLIFHGKTKTACSRSVVKYNFHPTVQ